MKQILNGCGSDFVFVLRTFLLFGVFVRFFYFVIYCLQFWCCWILFTLPFLLYHHHSFHCSFACPVHVVSRFDNWLVFPLLALVLFSLSTVPYSAMLCFFFLRGYRDRRRRLFSAISLKIFFFCVGQKDRNSVLVCVAFFLCFPTFPDNFVSQLLSETRCCL